MSKSEIRTLIRRLEGADSVDAGLLTDAAWVVRRVLPDLPEFVAAQTQPVNQLLHMIDVCLPGWTIQLTGKASEPDGHWRCSLRETRGSDEVEIIGLGAGRVVELALLGALLHVAEQKSPE